MAVNFYINVGGNNRGISDSSNANNNVAPVENDKNVLEQVSHSKASSIAVAKMMALSTIDYATSNVGKITGSEQIQMEVDNLKSIIGIGFIAKTNPLMALGTAGIQLATNAIDEHVRKNRDEVELAQKRARAGYTSSNVANYRRR